MNSFSVGDVVCIDGEPVRVHKSLLDAGFFDVILFPDTRFATDEEKASYPKLMVKKEEFPSDAAFKVLEKRCALLETLEMGFVFPRIEFKILPPILQMSKLPLPRSPETTGDFSTDSESSELPPLQSLETTVFSPADSEE
jgi:hypothetical protein